MFVNLDRRITIERRVTTKDATYSSPVTTWTEVARVWAEVRDVLPSRAESVQTDAVQASRQSRIRIRYREGIDSTMRVRYGQRILQIIGGPAEIGRKHFLEFMAEEFSSAGGS